MHTRFRQCPETILPCNKCQLYAHVWGMIFFSRRQPFLQDFNVSCDVGIQRNQLLSSWEEFKGIYQENIESQWKRKLVAIVSTS
jgi:hypothetical protein